MESGDQLEHEANGQGRQKAEGSEGCGCGDQLENPSRDMHTAKRHTRTLYSQDLPAGQPARLERNGVVLGRMGCHGTE